MSNSKLVGLLKSMDSDLMNDDTLVDKRRIVSPSLSGSESSSVVINKQRQKVDIRQDGDDREETSTSSEGEDEDEEDDFNDYMIEPPLPPPKELHPDKLYALFEFSGNDPSHCELERDDAVTLLNDQDGYWWLVKKETNGKIGFVPAECLETYEERLARLNCWKNEELEKNSKDNLDTLPLDSKSRLELKGNKSVTFSNDVNIAQDDKFDNRSILSNESSDTRKESEDEKYQYEATPYVGAEDEVVSDVFPITKPLIMTKKPPKNYSKTFTSIPYMESDPEDTSPLIAPNAHFFKQSNFSGSIGSYSPSSSEFESPETAAQSDAEFRSSRRKLTIPIEEIRANIPQSMGQMNIARSIKMLDDLIDDEINHQTEQELSFDTEKESDSNDDNTLSYDDNDESKLSSPIELNATTKGSKKSITSNIHTDSNYSNSNVSLQLSHSTTMDESVCESSPFFKSKDGHLHPEIDLIYKDSFSKIDEITNRLQRLNELMK